MICTRTPFSKLFYLENSMTNKQTLNKYVASVVLFFPQLCTKNVQVKSLN